MLRCLIYVRAVRCSRAVLPTGSAASVHFDTPLNLLGGGRNHSPGPRVGATASAVSVREVLLYGGETYDRCAGPAMLHSTYAPMASLCSARGPWIARQLGASVGTWQACYNLSSLVIRKCGGGVANGEARAQLQFSPNNVCYSPFSHHTATCRLTPRSKYPTGADVPSSALVVSGDVHYMRYYVGGEQVEGAPARAASCPTAAAGDGGEGGGASGCVPQTPFPLDASGQELPATAPILSPTREFTIGLRCCVW